jgi:hypothetical protein
MASHTEIKDILLTRIGWRQEIECPITVSAPNLVTDSGRYFQDEHSAVSIENIRDCQRIQNISDADLNTYLTQLREQSVYQVISDVFNKKDINSDEINANLTMFDQVILLRMVILVSEIIITSSRSNKTQRFSNAFIDKLHFDIIGSSNVRFAVTNRNYKYSMGVTSRYGAEMYEIKRFFGQQRMLKSVTRGEAININVTPLRTFNHEL